MDRLVSRSLLHNGLRRGTPQTCFPEHTPFRSSPRRRSHALGIARHVLQLAREPRLQHYSAVLRDGGGGQPENAADEAGGAEASVVAVVPESKDSFSDALGAVVGRVCDLHGGDLVSA